MSSGEKSKKDKKSIRAAEKAENIEVKKVGSIEIEKFGNRQFCY